MFSSFAKLRMNGALLLIIMLVSMSEMALAGQESFLIEFLTLVQRSIRGMANPNGGSESDDFL